LDKIPTLKSNKDSFIMAGEIVELLKQEAQDSDDSQSGDSDDSQSGDSDDSQSGDSNDSQGGDSNDSQSGDSNDSQSGDSNDSQGGDSDDSQGGDSNDSQSGDSDDSQSGELSQFINNALSASDKDLITDLHEAVEKELAKMAHDFNGASEEVNLDLVCRQVKRKVIYGEVDYEQANKMSGLLSRELYKVIHGLNLKNTTYSSRGSSIDANRLAGVGAGNYSVFSSSRVTKAPNMAMSIVVDNSGSMGDYCMKIANTSALSLSLAMDKLKEVKSETLYYDSDDVMHLAKSFNEKAAAVKSQFAVHPHGGTITGAALYTALRRIATRPEQKKVIFLLTDGDTYFEDVPVLLSTLELAKTLNVKVVCVGILAQKLGGFEEQEFLNVGDILELPRVLKKLVKANLLG
jgi:cobalamin biosynthesis protein CobT